MTDDHPLTNAHDSTDSATESPSILVGSETVAGIVRAVRRRSGMSQRDLAEAAGVASSTVAKLETGRLIPSLMTFLRILGVAELVLVVTDEHGDVVRPMGVWDDTHDAAGRKFPAHLDLIIDPRVGEWWGDTYGLYRPPETFHRSRTYRDAKRKLSQWSVRVKQFRHAPKPPDPDRPAPWRRSS
jgi:transcriptional regulator with XRE-family HTH domain